MGRATALATRELSARTWADFEELFRKPGEWGACWCVYYQRRGPLPKSETAGKTMAERAERNRRDKKAMVEERAAHGILVYDGEEPVGWCQYGLSHEIPRIDETRRYKSLDLERDGGQLWRISCFCVDREHRRSGVAEAGLAAALASIKKRGGGVVEAYPVTRKGALALWFGTLSMFRRHGFEVAAPFGRSNVLVRRRI